MYVIGIDAAKAGWVLVQYRHGHYSASVVATLDELPRADRIWIDMPIGLVEGRRETDQLLRRELRPGRTSSVFNAPFLSALTASNYMEANDLAKQHAGIGLSKQAWYLLPKIREVRQRYRSEMNEAHPEVCFARLAGHPARFSKKTNEGIAERIDLLEHFDCPPFWKRHQSHVAIDDWLDACLLATAARFPCEFLPADRPVDQDGYPLYAALPKKSPSPEWCG
ncbi:DUF429 domain-containing protein [Exiguobacterium sp. TDN 0502]|uniref:DUF429 domain-containing protein n=1 Tax=Exiguobacterium sp. TDN 0502 TaxID=3420731 RepID=UPI003D77F652